METEKVADILKCGELFSEFSDKEIHAIVEVGHVESDGFHSEGTATKTDPRRVGSACRCGTHPNVLRHM